MFFLLLVCDLVYRETAGCCFSFFRSFTSSFNLYIFSCLLFTYFLREPSLARKIFSYHSFAVLLLRKKLVYFFCGTFFALCSALVYISSIPVLHQIRTASSSRLSLSVLFTFMWSFFVVYFTFTLFPHRIFLSTSSMFCFGLVSFTRIFSGLLFVCSTIICCRWPKFTSIIVLPKGIE